MSKESLCWIYGLHSVRSAMNNPKRHINVVLTTQPLSKKFSPTTVLTRLVSSDDLTRQLPPGAVHQNIAAQVAPLPHITLENIIESATNPSTLVLLDQVTDPHNLGAIIRSSAALGAQGVITTKRNTPDVTGVVAKAASGALEHVPLVYVVNFAQAIDTLKKADFWCYGLDERGSSLSSETFPSRTAFVFGAEGKGMRALTANQCDVMLRLPTINTFSTLNVSTSVAVTLFARQQATRS